MKQTTKREIIGVVVPEGYKSKLAARAKKDGVKISDVVRFAIRKYLGVEGK